MEIEEQRRRLTAPATVDLTVFERRHQSAPKRLTPTLRSFLVRLADEATRSSGESEQLYDLAHDQPDNLYGPLLHIGLSLDVFRASPRLELLDLTAALVGAGYDASDVAAASGVSPDRLRDARPDVTAAQP
jgi:hypothetical protein